MIFKTALKYKIFEWCLDTLVNKLLTNFKVSLNRNTKVGLDDLYEGMHLSEIILFEKAYHLPLKSFKYVFKNCIITDLQYNDHPTYPNWDIIISWEFLNNSPSLYKTSSHAFRSIDDRAAIEFYI